MSPSGVKPHDSDGLDGVVGRSTFEQLCMFLEGRESVLEWSNDALQDPYHGAQPHGHQKYEDDDGPEEGKSRKQRDDVSKCHNGHAWALHNL